MKNGGNSAVVFTSICILTKKQNHWPKMFNIPLLSYDIHAWSSQSLKMLKKQKLLKVIPKTNGCKLEEEREKLAI